MFIFITAYIARYPSILLGSLRQWGLKKICDLSVYQYFKIMGELSFKVIVSSDQRRFNFLLSHLFDAVLLLLHDYGMLMTS